MTSTDATSPPQWAQTLLGWMLPVDREECVSGDLLEEYRESRLPVHGRFRADVWYFGQLGGFLWRLAGVFALAECLAMLVRTLADTYSPPTGDHPYQLRSAITTWTAVSIHASAGFYGAFRTARIRTGVIAALAAHAAASAATAVFDVLFFFIAVQADPSRLRLFEITGGWGEELTLPLMLVPVVAVLAFAGASCGALIRRLPSSRPV